jgi:hypothetical protein
MAELNPNSATTTNFTATVPDFVVNAISLDHASKAEKEFYYWYFPRAPQNNGYYLQIPEIFSATNALVNWAVGLGWQTEDMNLKIELEHVRGIGNETFSKVMCNHMTTKLSIGDAFTEVKRKENKIINMICISPERIRVAFKEGIIHHYEAWNGKEWKKIDREGMLHSTNKRYGDSCGGVSQIEVCKWIIDARNEALVDGRLIQNRGKALGIAYYKTDNAGKIAYANSQIEKAVKNGEMVGLPEGTVEIKEFPTKNIVDRQSWIAYLETFFYQVYGCPRSIVSSDNTSEVGGKMGHVTFQVPSAKEAMDLEEDLWNQQAIKVTFNRPPSLGGLVADNMNKSTGDTSIQPNDVMATMNRE